MGRDADCLLYFRRATQQPLTYHFIAGVNALRAAGLFDDAAYFAPPQPLRRVKVRHDDGHIRFVYRLPRKATNMLRAPGIHGWLHRAGRARHKHSRVRARYAAHAAVIVADDAAMTAAARKIIAIVAAATRGKFCFSVLELPRGFGRCRRQMAREPRGL